MWAQTRPVLWGLCPSARRKDNQRDRGSPSAAPAPLAQILLALATSILGEAKVASAYSTQLKTKSGKQRATWNHGKKILAHKRLEKRRHNFR
jgi:hypothetical protein